MGGAAVPLRRGARASGAFAPVVLAASAAILHRAAVAVAPVGGRCRQHALRHEDRQRVPPERSRTAARNAGHARRVRAVLRVRVDFARA